MQNPRQLFLLDTNSTPIQNSKMQAASSFTFSPVQLYSIIKPTQNGINRNKQTFYTIKSLEPLKNSNTSSVP
jgi:hypothetical protein